MVEDLNIAQIFHLEEALDEIQNHEENFQQSQISENKIKINFHRVVGRNNRTKKQYYCNCDYKTFNICHYKRHIKSCKLLKINVFKQRLDQIAN